MIKKVKHFAHQCQVIFRHLQGLLAFLMVSSLVADEVWD